MPVVILDYSALFIKDLFDISAIPLNTACNKLYVNEFVGQYR